MVNKKLELLDIVDSNNNIIGQASRQEIHQKNLMHRAAHIFIIYENLVYLQLRSAQKDQFPNLWDVSAAGHVNSGEDYIQTAIREVKEELDLDINNNATNKLIQIGKLPATELNGFEFIKIYCVKYNKIPTINLAQDEIATGAWFQIEHIEHWLKQQPTDFTGCFDLIFEALRNSQTN